MIENHDPRPETIVFVWVFLIIYLVYLIRKASRDSIDLFDLVCLSTVGIAPAVTVLMPTTMVKLARLLGVDLPFVLLFGFLFFVVFVYLAYMMSRLHKTKRMLNRAIQELSIQKAEIQTLVAERDNNRD